jgi:hypothetical protein
MKPVLVDRRQFAAQPAIEKLDNLRIALHPVLSSNRPP